MASAVNQSRGNGSANGNGSNNVNGNVNGNDRSTRPVKPLLTTTTPPSSEPLPPPPPSNPDTQHSDDEDDFHDAVSTAFSPTSVTSPPYWLNSSQGSGLNGSANRSSESLPAGAITLRDNETSDHDDRNSACWAKSVEITDYTVVNSSTTNIGAFVVWNIRVETLSGSYMNIRKRYSEFDEFRGQLIQSFPNFDAAVPVLPPKSVISKFRPRFLEKRRAGLQYFLNCILLNPEFSGSPVLKDFLFA